MKGYFQVEMFPDDIPKTAITMPVEFSCMPFGLQNAGSTFHHLMDRVLADLSLSILTTYWLRALTTPFIDNIFMKCFAACVRTASQSTRRSPSLARRSFGLRDSPAPWPRGGGLPISTPVITP